MMKAIWERNTPYSKFMITVGISIFSAIAFVTVFMVLAKFYYGIPMKELPLFGSNPNPSITLTKFLQTVAAVGFFLVPPIFLSYLFSSNPVKYLSLDRKPDGVSSFCSILLILALTPCINFLGEINSNMHFPSGLKFVEDWMRGMEDNATELTKLFLKMNTPVDLIINLLMIGLLPAVSEELAFRGIIQKIFRQMTRNAHVAIWITAFVFSAVHMQFYGFLPRMLLGGILGYLLVWSGSLYLPMLAHFINNAGAVVLIYLFQNEVTNLDPDKVGTENDFMVVLSSVVISGILLFVIYKRRRPEEQDEVEVPLSREF